MGATSDYLNKQVFHSFPELPVDKLASWPILSPVNVRTYDPHEILLRHRIQVMDMRQNYPGPMSVPSVDLVLRATQTDMALFIRLVAEMEDYAAKKEREMMRMMESLHFTSISPPMPILIPQRKDPRPTKEIIDEKLKEQI
jgi:hypothetical protein